jgi:hypothetical protein
MDNDFFTGRALEIVRFMVQLLLAVLLLVLILAWLRPHPEHPIVLPHPEHPIYIPGDNVPAHPIVLPPGHPATLPAYLKCEWQAGLPPPETAPAPTQ